MEEEEEDNRLEGGGGKNWIPLSCIEGGSGSPCCKLIDAPIPKLEEEDTEALNKGGGISCTERREGGGTGCTWRRGGCCATGKEEKDGMLEVDEGGGTNSIPMS